MFNVLIIDLQQAHKEFLKNNFISKGKPLKSISEEQFTAKSFSSVVKILISANAFFQYFSPNNKKFQDSWNYEIIITWD